MTKKIAAIVFAAGLLGASAAQATNNNPHFWGTLGIGMANNSVTLSENNNSDVFGDFAPEFNKASLSKLSAAGLARLGFGMNFYKCFHAGVFFDLIGDSYNSDHYLSNATGTELIQANTRVKSDFLTYGGGLRLGYKMDKTLLYASFAAVSRRYKVTMTSDNATTADVEFISSNKASTAFVPGIGLEYYITPCLAVGMQGTTEIHSSKTFEAEGLTTATGLGSWLKIKPANLTGLLTFTYKYNL